MAAEVQPVRAAARSHAPDFYLSALLAPRVARDDLVTLAAYLGEIARVALVVSEPALGAIRLQWWRDAIEKSELHARTGNPVADALVELMQRRGLSREHVLAPIDAFDHLLSRGSVSEEAEFAAYIDGTSTAAFRLAAHVLGCPDGSAMNTLLSSAGEAYGRARIALDLPYHLARGRLPLPMSYFAGRDPRGLGAREAAAAVAHATQNLAQEALEDLSPAKAAFARASAEVRAAVLPLALVEPYFRSLQRSGREPLRQPADISPLNRAARLWLARWRGRV